MGVFAASGQVRTFDLRAGDVGFVPFAFRHYIENTGSTTLRFLETFKSNTCRDASLKQKLALTRAGAVAGQARSQGDGRTPQGKGPGGARLVVRSD
jgi:oxalate decarboxylase